MVILIPPACPNSLLQRKGCGFDSHQRLSSVTLNRANDPSKYIHNWSLQSFSQAYNLVFNTIHVLCVSFYLRKVWPIVLSQPRTTNFIHDIFIYMTFLFTDFWNPLRKSRWKKILRISFCWRYLTWNLNQRLTSHKPTHYILHNSDFKFFSHNYGLPSHNTHVVYSYT